MFINTKKSFKVKADNATTFEARAGWIGEVPKWVEEHWYFKALCKDGSVTAIVSSRDKDIAKAVEPQEPADPPKADKQSKQDSKAAKSSAPKTDDPPKADGGDQSGNTSPVSVDGK